MYIAVPYVTRFLVWDCMTYCCCDDFIALLRSCHLVRLVVFVLMFYTCDINHHIGDTYAYNDCMQSAVRQHRYRELDADFDTMQGVSAVACQCDCV